jgi:hypothetical protein
VHVCSRLHSIRATRSSALRATFTGSTGFSTRPLPRTCDRRCPGQPDRDNPAPRTSNREGAASNWPKTPVRLLISQQPGWSLLPKEKTPPDATPRGQPRSQSAGFLGSGVVLTDRTRLHRSEDCLPEPRESGRGEPLFSTAGSSAIRNHGLWRDGGKERARRTNRRKARPAARGARQEGSEAGSRPFPRPKTPQVRVRCPEGPSIKGPHRIGQAHVPRETRVTRGPAEALAASSNAASTDESRESNDPLGARVRGQLQTLTRRIFPLGHGRPKGRQQTTG